MVLTGQDHAICRLPEKRAPVTAVKKLLTEAENRTLILRLSSVLPSQYTDWTGQKKKITLVSDTNTTGHLQGYIHVSCVNTEMEVGKYKKNITEHKSVRQLVFSGFCLCPS